MKMYFLIVFLFSFVFAQDDLFDLINDEPEKVEYVEYAFKGTRVANAQSLEIPKPKVLQFMILNVLINQYCFWYCFLW